MDDIQIHHFKTKQEMISFAKTKYSFHNNTPFHFIDLSFLSSQYLRFKTLLPSITPFYAIKSNDNPILLQKLLQLGCGFDCASISEISLIKSISKHNFNPHSIIFANPSKHISHIIASKQNGILYTTFDSYEELHKLKQYHPNAHLLLRIYVNDKNSKVHLSEIFGAYKTIWKPLIICTKEINMKLCGLCFHIGSISMEPKMFYEALKDCKELYMFCKENGIELSILDIGGGFPEVSYENIYGSEMAFERFATEINRGLDEFFKEEMMNGKIKVIAEPGRFFSGGSTYVFLKVINRKIWNRNEGTLKGEEVFKEVCSKFGNAEEEDEDDEDVNYYYCNESTGLTLSSFLYEDNKEMPVFIDKDIEDEKEGKIVKGRLYGFSSCKVDLIIKELKTKGVLPIGTRFYFRNLGAYSIACGKGVEVNGIKINEKNVYYFEHDDKWENN